MKKLAILAVALCGVLYVWTIWYARSLRSSDPVGYRNAQACFKLKPGILEADLVKAFGAPERTQESGGKRLLEFHTLSEAAAPIRAEIEAATGKVAALWCREDDQPTWSLGR